MSRVPDYKSSSRGGWPMNVLMGILVTIIFGVGALLVATLLDSAFPKQDPVEQVVESGYNERWFTALDQETGTSYRCLVLGGPYPAVWCERISS